MNTTDIRKAIASTLMAVPGIGRVQEYERYATAINELKKFYVTDDGQLLGWFVRRERLVERDRILPRSVEFTRWRIQGVMAIKDDAASELVFDGLIDAIRDAFRRDDTLGNTVAMCALPDGTAAGIQIDDAGPVMFAGVLCHGARLALNTVRYLEEL